MRGAGDTMDHYTRRLANIFLGRGQQLVSSEVSFSLLFYGDTVSDLLISPAMFRDHVPETSTGTPGALDGELRHLTVTLYKKLCISFRQDWRKKYETIQSFHVQSQPKVTGYSVSLTLNIGSNSSSEIDGCGGDLRLI